MSEYKQGEKKEILQLINELHFLVNNLPEHGQEFPTIEQDIIKETLRKIYIKFLAIPPMDAGNDKAQIQSEKEEMPAIENSIKSSIAAQNNLISQIQSVMTGNQFSHQEISMEIISSKNSEEKNAETLAVVLETNESPYNPNEEFPVQMKESATNDLPEVIQQENKAIESKTIEERIQQLRAAALYDEPSTIAHKYSATETIGDKITRSRTEKSLGEKLQHQPLGDLKQSIGINERFSFINELFQGNQQFYHQCIDQLNSMLEYKEAEKMISETLAVKFQWEKDSSRYRQFEELIRRRFNA